MTFGIKGILKMHEEAEADGEYSDDSFDGLRHYVHERGMEAVDVVSQRVSEKEFAIVMNTLSSVILARMWSDNCILPLFASGNSEEVTAYTHSLCLAILGVAMDEELL